MLVQKEVTDTNYVEHEEQRITIPLQRELNCLLDANGNIFKQDKIVKVNDKYYYRIEVDKLDVFSTTACILRTAENRVSFNYFVEDLQHCTWGVIDSWGLCSHFKQIRPADIDKGNYFAIWNGNKNIAITTDNTYLADASTSAKAIESWHNLLREWEANGQPLELYYPRENYKDIELTDTTTIEALKQLEKVMSYYSVTNVYSTDEVSPIMTLKYAKDFDIAVENKVREILATQTVAE